MRIAFGWLTLLMGVATTESALRYLSIYDYDPDAQSGWLTLGKTDNLTLLADGWKRHRIPALIELSKNDRDSLWCGNGSALEPCGGRGSAVFSARLQAFGKMIRPHLSSGACAGAFLGDELMAADGASWEDLSFVADSLRSVMGPNALLYENDAFHKGLIEMPRVPVSLNFFSADGCYGWSCPFDGPTGLRTAYEQHILPKLAPNQSAFVVPGTYECDSSTMEAPGHARWRCIPGNTSYDKYVASKIDEFTAWAASEPRIAGMCPWHYNNRCNRNGIDYQCGCTTKQAACKEVGTAGTPTFWQAGAMTMPRSLERLKTIGRGILRNATLQ
eukprot:SAG31_NODE_873_length_11325_cov_34.061197_4_plen_330_part_00